MSELLKKLKSVKLSKEDRQKVDGCQNDWDRRKKLTVDQERMLSEMLAANAPKAKDAPTDKK